MKCEELKECWVGEFSFRDNIRKGKGTLIEKGKEYYAEYDQFGKEITRKRTFEGIRLMIIGIK